MNITLNKPTIGRLIAELQKFPLDMPIIIEDADTRLTIDVIHVGTGRYSPEEEQPEKEVILWGEYGEMS